MQVRLPDVIGIGPAHAGTTWLHWVLKARVGLPLPDKETHFFDHHYDKGLAWYAERFAHCTDAAIVAEICPYFQAPWACERIARELPNCKIICQLRDPVDRAYSAYKFALYNELTHDDFERALETTPRITDGNRYAKDLSPWFERFRKERILVLLFDELRSDPQHYIDQVCAFIQVPRIDLASLELPARAINAHSQIPRRPSLARKARRAINWLQDRKLHRAVELLDRAGLWKACFAGEFPALKPATEQMLRERYLPEIEALERLIERDLSQWKPRHRSVKVQRALSV